VKTLAEVNSGHLQSTIRLLFKVN